MQHKWRIWLGLGVIVCSLAGFGYWLYDSQLQRSRLPIHERLSAIARLKSGQVSAWRRERLGDAEVLRLNAPLTREARRWLEGTATTGERAEMTAYLEQMCRQYDYAGFLLLDARGAIRHSSLALAENRLDAEGHEALTEAWRTHQAVLSDLHAGTEFPYPHLAVISPLFRNTEPAGAIVLLIDARATLFPLVQGWPGLSPSAEALMLRREGDDVLFLNDLRYAADAALKLRRPLSQRELPATRIVLGERGAIEGRDYRGVSVLVAGQPIPGSTWFVAAKVDAEEILAPARREALMPLYGLTITVLLLGGLARAATSWRRRQHETALRRLEAERQASLQQFANIFQQSLDGILLLTPDHRFLDAKPAALRMLGYRRDELLSLRLPAILAENERPRLAMEVPVTMAGTPHHQEWLHRRKDGSTFIGAVTALALDEQRYFATLRDLTEQKQRDSQEQARTRVLSLLARGGSLPTILKALVTTVETSHPDMLYGILLPDESGQHLIHGVAPNLPDFYNQAVEGIAIVPDIGSCPAAAYTGQRVIVRDVQTHPNWAPFRDITARAGLRACWSEPILSSDAKVLGTFAIYYPEPRDPEPADIRLIEESAKLAAIALERSRTLQALELSEQRYALANQATSNIIWDWDLVTGRVWWNDHFYALLGDTRETAPPSKDEWWERIHPDDQSRLESELEVTLAGDASEWSGTYRLRRQTGEYAEIEDHCHIQRDPEGRATRLVGAMQDVTRRNSAERQARQASDRYQRMLRASKDGFWLVNVATGRLLDVNQAACDLSGYSREDLLNMAILDLEVTHDEALVRQRTQQMLEAGGGVFETRHRTRSGRILEVEVSVIADAEAQLFLSFIRDITERKRTEQALRLTQLTIDRATDAVFWIREDGSFAYANDAACRSLDYEREELLRLRIPDIDPVYPFDTWSEHWAALQSGPVPMSETVHRARSGREFPVEINCSFLRFDGEQYIAAFVRDVTERKRQEQFLRLSQFALESATDAVYWIRPDSSFFYVNEAACRMLGYSREELLNMAVTDLNTEVAGAVWDTHWAGLKEHGAVRLETTHRARDGRIIPVEVAANYIQYEGTEYNCAIVRDITDRKKVEQTLRTLNEELEQRVAERTAALTQSEERLRKIAERVPGVIFQFKLRPDGSSCFPYASAGIQEFYGVTPEQVREDAAPVFAVIHPEDQEGFVAAILESARTQRTRQHEFRVRFADGTVRWRSGNATPEQQPDGSVLWHGYIYDITDLKLAEQDKIDREAYFRNLADAVPVMIWLMDVDRSCTFFNRTALEFRGRTLDQECGTGWTEGIHPEDLNHSVTAFTQAFQTRLAFSLDLRLRRHDGEWRWIQDMGVPQFDLKGEFQGYIGACIDITERKQAEQEIHELNANLERKVEERTTELVAASAAKSQFLAHMSHEIRTPMNAVLGLTQLLAQEPLAPGQAAMVRHIGEAGDSLLRIINDILDLSKIEAGQVQLESRPFALSALLHHIDSLLRPSAIRQGLNLAVTVPVGQPDRFLGDPTRLEQVLINLVGNAIKFTTAGSVELAATLLAECGQRARFRFSVRDTGIGLSPEAQVRLFQPFSQGDASITRRFGGTGLGLSISKRLVELMDGEMGLDSEEGRGSTFWFELTLPRAADTEPETPAADPAAATTEGPALAGLKILAVDDNRINLMVLEKALKKEAAKVTLAGDGQQALQVLQRQAQAFDLVLMDVQMPVMDGLTATREIRRNPALRNLPVIALTAGVLPEERQAALDAGMNGFLAKPLNLQ